MQILYVPNHAMGDITHPDVEAGFVVGTHSDAEHSVIICRFFNRDGSLRTVANSERCSPLNLVEFSRYDDDLVRLVLDAILDNNTERRGDGEHR